MDSFAGEDLVQGRVDMKLVRAEYNLVKMEREANSEGHINRYR